MDETSVKVENLADIAEANTCSRFSWSSEETQTSDSQVTTGLCEDNDLDRQTDPLKEDATRPNSPQLDPPLSYDDDDSNTLAKSGIIRHSSRRKGLVFMHSVSGSNRWETVSPTSNGDDSASEADSEEFDTTIRPNHEAVDINGTARPLQEDVDMVSSARHNAGCVPWLSNADSISDTEEPSIPYHARPSQSVSPTPFGDRYMHLPVGHPSHRKPVPRLEDYDRLFPARPQPKTTTSEPLYTLPQLLSNEAQLMIPCPEIGKAAMHSRFPHLRIPTPELRTPSPLRKVLSPFTRRTRRDLSTPSSRNGSQSPSRLVADPTAPIIGSTISLYPAPVISTGTRTSASPSRTTPYFSRTTYDSRYLSPASVDNDNLHLSPTFSVSSLSTLSTPEPVPSGHFLPGQLHTPQSLGTFTPKTPCSLPSTPARHRLVPLGEGSVSDHDSGSSSHGPTPTHSSNPSSNFFRSMARKVIPLPSVMRRTSSSKTVTQTVFKVSQSQEIVSDSPTFPTHTPNILRSPWMSDSESDKTNSPKASHVWEHNLDSDARTKHTCGPLSVPSSCYSSRAVSPFAPPFLSLKAKLVQEQANWGHLLSTEPHYASPSSLRPVPSAPDLRQRPAGPGSNSGSRECDQDLRAISKSQTRINRVLARMGSDLALRARSKSAGAKPGYQQSLGGALGLFTGGLSNGQWSSYEGGELGRDVPVLYDGRPMGLTPSADDANISGYTNSLSLTDARGLPLSTFTLPSSKKIDMGAQGSSYGPAEHRRQVEIATLSEFVEMLSAEHTRDYKRIRAMIDNVRASISGETHSGSSDGEDGEDSVVDSYMQNTGERMRKDAGDSDNALESHSRTLRAEDFAIDIVSLGREH